MRLEHHLGQRPPYCDCATENFPKRQVGLDTELSSQRGRMGQRVHSALDRFFSTEKGIYGQRFLCRQGELVGYIFYRIQVVFRHLKVPVDAAGFRKCQQFPKTPGRFAPDPR